MADGLRDGEENEVMLELSIGGIFGEPKKANRNARESVETDDRVMNRTKREVQALKRRELRRKREEKLKKPVDFGSCGSVSGPFVEDKEWLEKQIVQQNDDVLEVELVCKKVRIGKWSDDMGSGLTDSVINGFVSRKETPVVAPTACRSFRPYNMNVKPNEGELDGVGQRICNENSLDSSVYSYGQCASQQGVVATDNSRSHSSSSQVDQQLASTSAASVDPCDQPAGSSKQTATNSPSPMIPPEASIQHKEASLLARMPCVSTTGNGPNGKTISGFLYRYTKNEVSIVCVCHGESFSPAGFVEHAGGVDIAHPLKHITIFPTAFAS